MSIKDTISRVAVLSEEEFILARDEKHSESLRVTAFNIRRNMPEPLAEDIGIQKYFDSKSQRFFLRIFKRGIEDAEHWTRDKVTGELVPLIKEVSKEDVLAENERIALLMRKDGKSEEEIQAALKEV